MGYVAERMLEGVLCQGCGIYIDDEKEGYAGACGHPRFCGNCGGNPEANGVRTPKVSHEKEAEDHGDDN
jgi:hypothetical protein